MKRAHKYHAKATEFDGYKFDSKAEMQYYKDLKLCQELGEISGLEVHPRFELQPAFVDRSGNRHRAIVYEADFSFIENGQKVIVDVKGMDTQLWLVKRKMFLYRYPELDLRVAR